MRQLRHVVCALSGGVDSAVSAYLLKSKGFHVTGVYFRCWDQTEEMGSCEGDRDARDARRVAEQFGISFKEVDFVKEYWNKVFMYLVSSYAKGHTPNPDVLCNSQVKFGAFIDYAFSRLGAEAVAMGHYARNSYGRFLEARHPGPAKLLVGVDPMKDQTLFLCNIPQRSLQRTMFPIGDLLKNQVKAVAAEIGLSWILEKKSSRGICFIGKRDFHRFIDGFLEPKPGRFINALTGRVVGRHTGSHHYTIGQRARLVLPKHHDALFVARKDLMTDDIFVVPGTDHPMLYADTLWCKEPHMISASCNSLPFSSDGLWRGRFRFQHQMKLLDCEVTNTENPGELFIRLARPRRALTPGQFAVFYDGDVCLGSAVIDRVGPSVHELDRRMCFDPDTTAKPGVHREVCFANQ